MSPDEVKAYLGKRVVGDLSAGVLAPSPVKGKKFTFRRTCTITFTTTPTRKGESVLLFTQARMATAKQMEDYVAFTGTTWGDPYWRMDEPSAGVPADEGHWRTAGFSDGYMEQAVFRRADTEVAVTLMVIDNKDHPDRLTFRVNDRAWLERTAGTLWPAENP